MPWLHIRHHCSYSLQVYCCIKRLENICWIGKVILNNIQSICNFDNMVSEDYVKLTFIITYCINPEVTSEPIQRWIDDKGQYEEVFLNGSLYGVYSPKSSQWTVKLSHRNRVHLNTLSPIRPQTHNFKSSHSCECMREFQGWCREEGGSSELRNGIV